MKKVIEKWTISVRRGASDEKHWTNGNDESEIHTAAEGHKVTITLGKKCIA